MSMALVRRQGRDSNEETHDAVRHEVPGPDGPDEGRSRPGAVSGANEAARQVRPRSRRDLRASRRRRGHRCWDHLIAAPLWPLHGANLGTLLRTCDAVGACLAVPRWPWVPEALARGNTLRSRSCVHWVNDAPGWLRRRRAEGTRILGVELAENAVRLADLPMADRRTVLVLGHEQDGIPPEALDLLDEVVEIPMIGTGASLNVAVAGSLVLYRLAGMS
jgi:tRNA (guanosine-2'-O-)-methyltransferase